MKTIKLFSLISLLLAVGCSASARLPRLASTATDLHDKYTVRGELGDPDAVLELRKSTQGCTERWTYSGAGEVMFVDFNPLGSVCDYTIGATGK